MASVVYNRFWYNLALGNIDWEGDTINAALVGSGYTPDKDDVTWETGSDPFDQEVTGTNYSAGGAAVANAAVTQDDTNDLAKLDGDNVTWASSTIDADYAVLYDDTLANKDLICCFDFGGTESSVSGTFELQFNASGIITIAQAA